MDDITSQRDRWARLFQEQRAGLEIQYQCDRRGRVFELTSTGALLGRSYGGPLYYMGQVTNREARTVEVWQGYHDPRLHGLLCQALCEAGFPWPRARFNPVPDERPSSVVVRRRVGVQRLMPVVSRFLGAFPLLATCLEQLESAGLQLINSRPADGTRPNPELEFWTDAARKSGNPPRPPAPAKQPQLRRHPGQK